MPTLVIVILAALLNLKKMKERKSVTIPEMVRKMEKQFERYQCLSGRKMVRYLTNTPVETCKSQSVALFDGKL